MTSIQKQRLQTFIPPVIFIAAAFLGWRCIQYFPGVFKSDRIRRVCIAAGLAFSTLLAVFAKKKLTELFATVSSASADDLNKDVLSVVFKYLKASDIPSVALTCKRFREVVNTPILQRGLVEQWFWCKYGTQTFL